MMGLRERRESAFGFRRVLHQLAWAVAVAVGIVLGVHLLGLVASLAAPAAERVVRNLAAVVASRLSQLTAAFTVETNAYAVTNTGATALLAMALVLAAGGIVWLAVWMWDEIGGTLLPGFTAGLNQSPYGYGRRKFAEAAGAAGCGAILYLSAGAAFIGIGLLVRAVNSMTFRNANLTASAVLVAIPMAAVLRPSVVRQLTWKRLGDPWLKWSGVSGLAVGGFGFAGLGLKDYDIAVLKTAVTYSQVPLRILIAAYMILILVWGIGLLLWLVGSTLAGPKSDEVRVPTLFFLPAFVLAWLGNLGFYTLFVDSMLLTLAGHLRTPMAL